MTKLHTNFLVKIKQVSEGKYLEMLEVLPPAAMTANAFLVGEPVDYEGGRARVELYFCDGGQYFFGGLATLKDWAENMIFKEGMPDLIPLEKYGMILE